MQGGQISFWKVVYLACFKSTYQIASQLLVVCQAEIYPYIQGYLQTCFGHLRERLKSYGEEQCKVIRVISSFQDIPRSKKPQTKKFV